MANNVMVDDAVRAIVNSILSGNNACGTLQQAVAGNNRDYFVQMVRPTVTIIHEQYEDCARQVLKANQRITELTSALEYVAQNIGGAVEIRDQGIRDILSQALGRKA